MRSIWAVAQHTIRPERGRLLHLVPAAWLQTAPCGTGTASTPCTFLSLLHLLQFLAILLGCILIGVLALAIHVYRKNRISPDDRRRGNRKQKQS